MKTNKTVGIIGGLGPETTARFYLELINSCKDENKINYPSILIKSVALPFDIEKNAIMKAHGEEMCLPYLIDAAKTIEMGGADFLVMPCNSLHKYIDNIRESVKIPVVSIIEETSKFLIESKVDKVGIIATQITIKNKLYKTLLSKNKIKQIIPSKFQQEKINKVIHNLVSNDYNENDKRDLVEIIDDFRKQNLNSVILACTDLQLLLTQNDGIKIYDTMKILVDATAKIMCS